MTVFRRQRRTERKRINKAVKEKRRYDRRGALPRKPKPGGKR